MVNLQNSVHKALQDYHKPCLVNFMFSPHIKGKNENGKIGTITEGGIYAHTTNKAFEPYLHFFPLEKIH